MRKTKRALSVRHAQLQDHLFRRRTRNPKAANLLPLRKVAQTKKMIKATAISSSLKISTSSQPTHSRISLRLLAIKAARKMEITVLKHTMDTKRWTKSPTMRQISFWINTRLIRSPEPECPLLAKQLKLKQTLIDLTWKLGKKTWTSETNWSNGLNRPVTVSIFHLICLRRESTRVGSQTWNTGVLETLSTSLRS